MKKEDAVKFLKMVGSSKIETVQKDWIKASCPFAHWKHAGGKDKNPSFGLRLRTNGEASTFHCFTCRSHGVLGNMVHLLRNFNREDPSGITYPFLDLLQLIASEEDEGDLSSLSSLEDETTSFLLDTPFTEQWLSKFPPAYRLGDHGKKLTHSYLNERGIPYETAKRFDIRWDPSRFRICFPIRDFNGVLYGLHGRDVRPNSELRYYAYGFPTPLGDVRNPRYWMGEENLNLNSPVIISEGMFDIAKISQVYDNVACSLTTAVTEDKLSRLAMCGHIITFYDHGVGGDVARDKVEKYYSGKNIIVEHLIPTEEQDDAGAMSLADIAKLIDTIL